MQFNELVISLLMNRLCYYQLSLEIVHKNLPLFETRILSGDRLCTFF